MFIRRPNSRPTEIASITSTPPSYRITVPIPKKRWSADLPGPKRLIIASLACPFPAANGALQLGDREGKVIAQIRCPQTPAWWSLRSPPEVCEQSLFEDLQVCGDFSAFCAQPLPDSFWEQAEATAVRLGALTLLGADTNLLACAAWVAAAQPAYDLLRPWVALRAFGSG